MTIQTKTLLGATVTYENLEHYVGANLMVNSLEFGAVETATAEVENLRASYARLLELLMKRKVVKPVHLPYIVEGGTGTKVIHLEE